MSTSLTSIDPEFTVEPEKSGHNRLNRICSEEKDRFRSKINDLLNAKTSSKKATDMIRTRMWTAERSYLYVGHYPISSADAVGGGGEPI